MAISKQSRSPDIASNNVILFLVAMISSTLDTGNGSQDSTISAMQLLAPSSAFSQPFYSQSFFPNFGNKRAFTSVKVPNPIKATSPLPTPQVKSTSPFQPPSKSPKLSIENPFTGIFIIKAYIYQYISLLLLALFALM